ncbi:hypothetical protein PHLGIDRAFT_76808 [Phlebiopsis gigantea 11061_1 CR5-6]|uniref:C3H1-type domain-containing protein n=1 Tax=Phlebiopsis gigantea (strain 11061_1 CR5-6) TaxID=745531 RepID=A0A0C3S2P8_PHLG1|nr:hypothetical protein PHLGIDRAFT_76808 [Phlebiopsis gigantea 11061_1 CR5-6]
MSQRAPGRCRLFQQGSCRFGNKCKFSHDATPATSNRGGGTHSNTRNNPPGASRASPAPPGASAHSNAPVGVCRMFWTAGTCNRAFECTFKHLQGTTAPAGQANKSSDKKDNERDTTPDFFSGEGLAMSAGATTLDRHNLTPVEAHNHMKPFLRDNFHFEKAAKIQGFVRILASVNDQNKAWAFLDAIVTGNGILRIGDVLRFKPVGHCIGSGSDTLSFQRGYFPVLAFISSDLILKTTMHKNINHLYTIVEHNYDDIQSVIKACMSGMIAARTWKDTTFNLPPMLQSDLDGALVFKALTTVYLQFINRFKDTIKNHPDLIDFVHDYSEWFETWATAVKASPPQFQDTITGADADTRRLIIDQLHEEVDRLVTIVDRDSNHANKAIRKTAPLGMTPEQRRQARIMQLMYTYDPPGDLRDDGRRHDNDFEDISDIRIAPTHDELLSPVAPYLPVFMPDAPHHLPENSMERHLDIQFRLLREELIAPLRIAVVTIDNDINTMRQGAGKPKKKRGALTKLEEVLAKGGGAYKTSGFDSVFFRVYANAAFMPVKAERRDLTVGLELDAPPSGGARDKDAKKREAYWEHSRLLQSGSLVALVILFNNNLQHVYLGTITSFGKDIAESSKADKDRIQVRLKFFDPEVELMAMRRQEVHGRTMFLVDNDVMYEASRPFLERLQTIEPTEIPFARYIAHGGVLQDVQVLPPRYATAPQFRFKLSSLAKKGVDKTLLRDLNVSLPGAIQLARTQLQQYSELDASQVDAVINTMTREVSLIQGPPGTGKSYTGKKIFQLLVGSGVRPIILIAYTNHALDHMLTGVLDDGITNKLVRLGSRSSDERIAEYTLDKLEKLAGRNNLDRSIHRQYGVMKRLEEDMSNVMRSIQEPALSFNEVTNYLQIHYPDHADSLSTPPYWIKELAERHWKDEQENGEWQTGGKGKGKGKDKDKDKAKPEDPLFRSLYVFWRQSLDIAYVIPQVSVVEGAQVLAMHPMAQEIFFELGYGSASPPIPDTSRPLDELLDSPGIWSMSPTERITLATQWEEEMRSLAYTNNLDQYEKLRVEYQEACKEYNDIRDEVSLSSSFLCPSDKRIDYSSIAPRVLMVEEAGQVLEAHIMTSLVTSVHHLICIGDPEQLRPTLATFALSMDSARGKELFKFDRSLMERLADAKLPMTQINVQRRMRPDISHFIREILYPKLEDHSLVAEYPHVQGMQNDVYFLNHTNAEGGAEDSSSKYNMYEVEMVRDLVLYFLRQGEYSGPGDIAVLCAYLGQLQKVRQALRDLKIAVAVDERDEQQLAHQGIAEEVNFEQVVVAKHIALGTVDIFQGREAKIVIVSLVRNTGTHETDSAPIGFLKSSNRINVSLSRAKHGLFILGNASNLRKNKTWSTVLDEMEARGQIGPTLPIICPRHPNEVQEISKPGELSRFAPGGGCLLPCGTQLPCGHICPSVVIPSAICHAPRLRVLAITRVKSAVSRIVATASSQCTTSSFRSYARETGRRAMHEESRQEASSLRAFCDDGLSSGPREAQMQGGLLRDSGLLREDLQHCGFSHADGPPQAPMRKAIVLSPSLWSRLRQGASLPPAVWSSEVQEALFGALSSLHGAVHVAFTELIHCLVCGEQCDIQVCPVCVDPGRKSDVVDFIMQRTLEQLDLTSTDVSERLITLGCRHFFTVETLDGHCQMSEFYDVDEMGQFLSMKAPPSGYQLPPTCPTCRGPITSLRYGRVTKRATLDILEQNVASHMSKMLESMNPDMVQLSDTLEKLKEDIKKVTSDMDNVTEPAPSREAWLTEANAGALPVKFLDNGAMHSIHGFSVVEAKAWFSVVKDIVRVYRRAHGLSATRGAHNKAYEGALTTLYRLEMDAIAADPSRATDTPEPIALAAVMKKIGQPPPKADVRFQIDTTFTLIELRFMLAEICASRIEALPLTETHEVGVQHRRLWTSFAAFVYRSCLDDSKKALAMAQNSSASRQAANCSIYAIRSEFEHLRFQITEDERNLTRPGATITREDRDRLGDRVKEAKEQMRITVNQVKQKYIRSRPVATMDKLHQERQWFEENCGGKVARFVQALDELEIFVRRGGVYAPLSMQEREMIVKAFDFGYTGHFYNCPNGHPYTIGEVRHSLSLPSLY